MFLKSIYLNNVKCFSDIALSFENERGDIRKRTLLLAENGMGKSTLLKAIALITGGSDAINDLLDEPSDWIRYKAQNCEISAVLVTKEREEEKISLRIESKDTRADVIVKNKHNLVWLDDALKQKKEDYFVLGFGASRHLNTVDSRRTNTSTFTNKRAQSVATLFDPNATTTSLDSWAMDLDYLENRTGLETVRKVLSNLLPEIKFHRIDKQSGHLLFKTPDGIIPLHCLSDGYLAMAAWMGDLLFRVLENFDDLQEQPLTAKGLLLIDEVDLHLHPKRQRELLAFLDKWLPNFQLVVTTHSPMAAQQAREGELHCLTRERRKIHLYPFSGAPNTLLLHQLVMSPAFGLDTDESKEIEDMKNRYRHLRDKANLSSKDQEELNQLKATLTELPTSDRSNMKLSEEHAQLLQKIEKELLEGRG
ncbi:AAA family ATPase [Candidatus Poribacteria bacterium]|nr:AAA family ATPase [Candidatus Poribacteria bacterium]